MYEHIREITFKITSYCNLKCTYCFQKPETKETDDCFNDFKSLRKFVSGLPLSDYVEFKITGGESSLYPDRIRNAYKELKKIERENPVRCIFSTISNGTNMQTLINLMNDGILHPDYCKISYDGIYSASKSRLVKFDKYQDPDQYFNNQIKILGNSKYRDRVLIRTALTNETIDNLDESLEFILSTGCRKWEYYYISDYEDYKNSNFIRKFIDKLNKIVDIYNKIPFNFYNITSYKYFMNHQDKDYRLTKCRHLGRFLYIGTDGKIYPCGYFSPDGYYSEERFEIGDIYNGFNQERIKAFAEEYEQKPSCSIASDKKCQLYHCFECPAVSHYRKKHMMHRLQQQCIMRGIEHSIFREIEDLYFDNETIDKIMTPYNQ